MDIGAGPYVAEFSDTMNYSCPSKIHEVVARSNQCLKEVISARIFPLGQEAGSCQWLKDGDSMRRGKNPQPSSSSRQIVELGAFRI
jgi:hypothetical protein